MPTDKRVMVSDPVNKDGPKVKGCVVCEAAIPDSDESGIETGACSPECYESPDYEDGEDE